MSGLAKGHHVAEQTGKVGFALVADLNEPAISLDKIMTNEEAVRLLTACKALAERASVDFPAGLPSTYSLTKEDLKALQGFDQVQNDPLVAGPSLLNRMFKAAGLSQVEVYKLEQIRRLVFRRRYLGRNASDGLRPTAR